MVMHGSTKRYVIKCQLDERQYPHIRAAGIETVDITLTTGAKSSAEAEGSVEKTVKKGLPGFVGVSAIAGLLAALYLVRRRM